MYKCTLLLHNTHTTMTDNDEDRLVAEIPSELKDLVDADSRSNKDVVIAALWREYGGERKSSLERRIEEKERRISMVKSEKNERERELEEHRDELNALQQKRERLESEAEREERLFEDAVDDLQNTPRDPESPPIQHWANRLDMSPGELCEELPPVESSASSELRSMSGDTA